MIKLSKLKEIKAVSAIIIDKKKRLLLLKRSSSSKLYSHFWQLPEGKIKFRENPKLAILRELQEELGIEFQSKQLKYIGEISIQKNIPLIGFLPLPKITITRKLYACQKPLDKKKIKLSKEHSEYGFFEKKEIEKLEKKIDGLLDICFQGIERSGL